MCVFVCVCVSHICVLVKSLEHGSVPKFQNFCVLYGHHIIIQTFGKRSQGVDILNAAFCTLVRQPVWGSYDW